MIINDKNYVGLDELREVCEIINKRRYPSGRISDDGVHAWEIVKKLAPWLEPRLNEKLVKISVGRYLPDDESGCEVTLWHVVDENLACKLEMFLFDDRNDAYKACILEELGITECQGEIAPGARYETYSVECIGIDLVAVVKTMAFNV